MYLGSIKINKPLLLAPMENITDQPFRIVCKRLGADIVYTEFVNVEGLIRASAKTIKKMDYIDEERPFGIQIYGGNESSMKIAACIAESHRPDLIDINCGCWVRNIVSYGAGSGLLRDLPQMGRIVSAVVNSVKLPVTVKTRLGWDSESICIIDIAKMLEQIGVSAITVHCRTRSQAHNGEPDFSWIPKIKLAVSIPIIANGSLNTPQRIKQVFDETGCDGVMIGRAAIYNPWIFQHTRHFLDTGKLLTEITIEDRFRILFEHLDLSIKYKGEKKGIIEFRKHYSGYLKGMKNSAKIRQELMKFTERAPLISHLQEYHENLLASEPIQFD